jgi:hypothetical protein
VLRRGTVLAVLAIGKCGPLNNVVEFCSLRHALIW